MLAIDPGRNKCGLAVLRGRDLIDSVSTVPTGALGEALSQLDGRYAPETVILGDGTTHGTALETIRARLPRARLLLYPEAYTTLEARTLYFERNPPRGWRRLIPRFLLLPEREMDGWAAAAIALRYLAHPEAARPVP